MISVCIPTYNRANYLQEAIRSVLAQTYTDFELIVSDNASTDNTKEIVGSFSDPRLKYYCNESNIGMANNWNRCLALAGGDYVAILSSDDYWEPQFLEKLMPYMKDGAGVVFSNHYYLKNDRKFARKRLLPPGKVDNVTETVIKINPISINASIINKKCLDQVGGFLNVYTADYDLWLRISQTKWDVIYVDEPLATYRVHDSALSADQAHMCMQTITVLLRYKFSSGAEAARRQLLARLLREYVLIKYKEKISLPEKSLEYMDGLTKFLIRNKLLRVSMGFPLALKKAAKRTVKRIILGAVN